MKIQSVKFKLIPGILFLLSAFPSVHAIGTVDTGWMYVEKIKKLESRGLFFDSWEGIFEVTSYDKKEKCDKKKEECFTPVDKDQPFSIRKNNSKAVQFLRKKDVEGDFLIRYRIHRIEKLTLSSRFEVLDIIEIEKKPPENFPRKLVVKRTGYRNFNVEGEVLRFGRQGICFKTFEGMYRDKRSGKVHPFSVTQKEMADYVYTAMKYSEPFNIGISDAIAKAVRKSDYDIFEINYDEKAGSSLVE
ncbi:MAG: hypothetical protein OEZ34_08805 [Spirochaetia bacterium]|nr:hypothetical protein [Spirochaetia bacterium]